MEKDKDIQKELNELAPNLAKMPRNNPFMVSDDFFQEQEADLQALQFAKDNPFEVPQDYFEHLQHAISKKITEPASANKGKVRQLYFKYASVAAAAAVIIFVALLFNDNKASIQAPSDTEINQYLISNIDVMEYNVLLDQFSATDIETLEGTIPTTTADSIEELELEDYIKYNIDLNTIEGELL